MPTGALQTLRERRLRWSFAPGQGAWTTLRRHETVANLHRRLPFFAASPKPSLRL
jgi:hypothetical protein